MHRLRAAASVQRHKKVRTEISVINIDLFTLENFGVDFHGPLIFGFVDNTCTVGLLRLAAELELQISYAGVCQGEQYLTWRQFSTWDKYYCFAVKAANQASKNPCKWQLPDCSSNVFSTVRPMRIKTREKINCCWAASRARCWKPALCWLTVERGGAEATLLSGHVAEAHGPCRMLS